MKSILFTCVLVLVATAVVATAQTLPSLAAPPSSGPHRFSLAQASRTVEASGTATSDEAKAAELAKQLQNPIANLISVPLQNNWDFGIGPADAMRYTVNIQPVIPLSLSTDWNLIIRTILPVIYAESPVPGGDNTAGLGDIAQSFFFSPKVPTRGGWIWGVGPVSLYPTATDEALGAEQFGPLNLSGFVADRSGPSTGQNRPFWLCLRWQDPTRHTRSSRPAHTPSADKSCARIERTRHNPAG